MKIVFLGSGTSTGVPQIGCKCKVCTSLDPKDKRLRASVLITVNDTNILIDCGPDLRQQMLTYNVSKLNAILISHEHYDHIGGLDDVRPFGNVQVYAEKRVLSAIKLALPYCFAENKYPGIPKIHLNEITTQKFELENITIEPIRVMHAKLPILGYKIGKFAYLTDVKSISDDAIKQLTDLDVLVINALRIQEHISHISLSEALEITQKIGAKKTYFTHMSHDMGLHKEFENELPENIYFSYDGLIVNI